MSMQRKLPGFDGAGFENKTPAEAIRASIAREMRYLFAISNDAGRGYSLSPSGIVHSLGVCLIEDWNMARGKGQQGAGKGSPNLPTFVDVKLSAEDRENFLAWCKDGADPVKVLTHFADDGYRVGLSWSGEHQTYTCSVTCRDVESDNNGLCMTSFSRDIAQAVLLAWFKHDVICRRTWKAFEPDVSERFG